MTWWRWSYSSLQLQLLFWLQLKRRAREFTILLLSFFFLHFAIYFEFVSRSELNTSTSHRGRRDLRQKKMPYATLNILFIGLETFIVSFRCGCCCRLKWRKKGFFFCGAWRIEDAACARAATRRQKWNEIEYSSLPPLIDLCYRIRK